MQLKHLKSFVTVAQTLHFGRAAEQLDVTQPALSHHIMQLEADVGARLFDRDRRSVELTPAGEKLLCGARAALARLDEAVQSARALGETRARTLLVGQVDYNSHSYLPRAVQSLKQQFPDATVDTRDLIPSDAIAAVRAGTIDIAFAISFGQDTYTTGYEDLVVRTVLKGEWMVVLPESHPLAAQPELKLSALAGQDLILFQRRVNPGLYDWWLLTCEAAGFTPRITHHVSQPQHGPAMVAEKIGAFIVGSYVLPNLYPGTVWKRLSGMPEISISALWQPGRRTPLLKAFLAGLSMSKPQTVIAAVG